MKKQLPLRYTLSVLIVLAIGSTGSAQFLPGGGVDTTDPVLPPPGVYLSPSAVHSIYSGTNLTIVLSALYHQPFKDRDPTYINDGAGPDPEGELHDFDSDLRGQGACLDAPTAFGACAAAGIPAMFPVEMDGRVQTVALGKDPPDTTGTFTTLMIGMNLSGGGVLVRESPTLQSIGQTRITETSPGMYHIDSFFDVFTELSLDGGNNWIPSAGPTRVDLVPEPASALFAGLALLAMFRIPRRHD